MVGPGSASASARGRTATPGRRRSVPRCSMIHQGSGCVASLVRKGPLHGRAPWQGEGLRFAGSDLLSCFLLRGRPDEAMQQRIASLLGCRLPGTPIVIEHGKGAQVLMLAPCRWMIFASRESSPALLHQLQEILGGSFVAVSDASDSHVHITVEG